MRIPNLIAVLSFTTGTVMLSIYATCISLTYHWAAAVVVFGAMIYINTPLFPNTLSALIFYWALSAFSVCVAFYSLYAQLGWLGFGVPMFGFVFYGLLNILSNAYWKSWSKL